jgi:hypothetical protein
MDTNKLIAKALLNKSFSEAKELVFKSLYAKSSLALDEARYDVANSVFNEAKKSPATSVPAGASEEEHAKARAANPYRVRLGKGKPAGAVDKAVKEEAELDEMAITAARAREHNRAIDRADHKAWAYTNPNNRKGMWKDGKAKSPAHIKKGKGLEKAYDSAVKKLDTERASKTLYGRGGKAVKK